MQPAYPCDVAVQGYLRAGPKMSETVARVPLVLLDDDDCGLKGCVYYAVTH